MSVSFKSFEQVIAEIATVTAIKLGSKSTADQLARAQAANSVAGIFKTASTGDFATAATQLSALITSTTDPGVAAVVTDLTSIGNTFLSAEGAVLAATPLIGQTVEATLSNVATGMANIASAYIAKYGTTTVTTSAAS